MTINYSSPWDVRYYAKDYAQTALDTVVQAGYWPADSLEVQHTDPASPTHWRVVLAGGKGITQQGW